MVSNWPYGLAVGAPHDQRGNAVGVCAAGTFTGPTPFTLLRSPSSLEVCMIPPPVPDNEGARLLLLADYAVLDTDPEPAFDSLARIAAQLFQSPIVLISLVDEDRQWFKASVGMEARETPRSVSLCGHVVGSGETLLVADTLQDERFYDNPLCVGPPGIRSYAGAPLRSPGGLVLGTLCLIDRVPRQLPAEQRELLEQLAAQVVAQLELRRVRRSKSRLRVQHDATVAQAQSLLNALPGLCLQFSARGQLLGVAGRADAERLVRSLSARDGAIEPAVLKQAIFEQVGGKLRDAVIRTVETGQVELFEFEVAAADRVEYFEAHVATEPGSDTVVALVLNITRRVKAERRLRESQELLTTVIDNAPIGIVVHEDGKCLLINKTIERYVGGPISELSIASLVSRQHSQGGASQEAKVLAPAQRASTVEAPSRDIIVGIPSAGESVIWAQLVSVPLPDNPQRCVTLVSDVTDRVEAEAERRRERERMHSIIDAALDAIVVVDESLTIQEVNSAFGRLFGYEPEAVVGRSIMMLMADDSLKQQQQADAQRPQAHRLIGRLTDSTALRQDGSSFPVEVSLSEFFDHGCRCYCATLRDTTQRKRLEHYLAEHELRLRSSIAYDLHDGVSQNLAGARLLLQGVLRDSDKPQQQRLERVSSLLTDALDQIRQLSRSLDITEVADAPLAESLRALASKNFTLFGMPSTVEIAADVPEPPPIDKTQAYLVAKEAAVNAARHSVGTMVSISLDMAGSWYRLRVADDGIGLHQQRSAGLGLTSMRYRAHILGGTLEMTEQPGGGTLITLRWLHRNVDESAP